MWVALILDENRATRDQIFLKVHNSINFHSNSPQLTLIFANHYVLCNEGTHLQNWSKGGELSLFSFRWKYIA